MNFDQIYTDITAHVIPKIAEGISITKDYAFDLFGRYIKFLIVSDSILLIINIILFITSIIAFKKLLVWANNYKEETYSSAPPEHFVLIVPAIVSIVTLINTISYSQDLIQDIFVPEVRLYELYNSYKK